MRKIRTKAGDDASLKRNIAISSSDWFLLSAPKKLGEKSVRDKRFYHILGFFICKISKIKKKLPASWIWFPMLNIWFPVCWKEFNLFLLILVRKKGRNIKYWSAIFSPFRKLCQIDRPTDIIAHREITLSIKNHVINFIFKILWFQICKAFWNKDDGQWSV